MTQQSPRIACRNPPLARSLGFFASLALALWWMGACTSGPGPAAPDARADDVTVDASASDATSPRDMDATSPRDMDATSPLDMDATSPRVDGARPDATGDADDCGGETTGTLTLPTSVSGALSGTGEELRTSCGSFSMPRHTYRLRVTERTGLALDLRVPTPGERPILVVRAACGDEATERACETRRSRVIGDSSSTLLRAVLDAGEYDVLVVGYPLGGSLAYVLTATAFTPAPNATCATASVLSDAAPLLAQDTANAGSASAACDDHASGGELFYSLEIPAGQRAFVTATAGTPDRRLIAQVRAACGAECVTSDSVYAARAGGSTTVQVDNPGAGPRRVVVTVSFGIGGERGDGVFDLAARFAPLPPPGPTCAEATRVTDGVTLRGEDLGRATAPAPSCGTDIGRNGLYYVVTVPPRHTLVPTVTGATGWTPSVQFRAGCAADRCLFAVGAGPGPGSYTNESAAPMDIVLVVTSVGAIGGTFDLHVAVRPPPTNTTCAAALPLASGADLHDQATYGASAILAPTCGTGAAAPTVYYRVSVPPGEALMARAAVHERFDPAMLRLLAECGGTSCLADGAGAVTYANTAATPREVILALSTRAALGAAPGAALFDLGVILAPLPYDETTIAPACDDMATGTILLGAFTRNSATAIQALPFEFTYFGDAVTHYSVSSNGFAQLYAAAGATPIREGPNQVIPLPTRPDGMIAAFWDDLEANAAGTSHVRVQTFGVAPRRRLTLQWTDWTLNYPGDPTRLTFQAQLFETTGVVELHYCALHPGTSGLRHTGNQATVGMESLDGARGVQHSFNVPDAVATMRAIRYTPRP
jgi:hypothetical protein